MFCINLPENRMIFILFSNGIDFFSATKQWLTLCGFALHLFEWQRTQNISMYVHHRRIAFLNHSRERSYGKTVHMMCKTMLASVLCWLSYICDDMTNKNHPIESLKCHRHGYFEPKKSKWNGKIERILIFFICS